MSIKARSNARKRMKVSRYIASASKKRNPLKMYVSNQTRLYKSSKSSMSSMSSKSSKSSWTRELDGSLFLESRNYPKTLK